MKTEPNVPAHPIHPNTTLGQQGLTKREYFAGLVMQGMVSDIKEVKPSTALDVPANIVQWSVSFADALIAELNKD